MIKPATYFCLIGVGFIILVSFIWLGTRWYGVVDVVQSVTVLSSEDEAFIFIGHGKAVLTDKQLNLLGKELTSALLIPDHVSDDLLVVQLKDGKVSSCDLTGFGIGGTPFVYHGKIFWSGGGDTGPTRWKWSGS